MAVVDVDDAHILASAAHVHILMQKGQASGGVVDVAGSRAPDGLAVVAPSVLQTSGIHVNHRDEGPCRRGLALRRVVFDLSDGFIFRLQHESVVGLAVIPPPHQLGDVPVVVAALGVGHSQGDGIAGIVGGLGVPADSGCRPVLGHRVKDDRVALVLIVQPVHVDGRTDEHICGI